MLLFAACGTEKKALLLDGGGNVIAEYDGTLAVEDERLLAYAKYALQEAAGRIATRQGGDVQKALRQLRNDRARILTAADTAQIAAAAEACETFFAGDGTPFAVAVADENARLIAICSSTGEIGNTYAGSAIKPLSVYAPCIDAGIMDYSSLQKDSPVKTVQTAAGESPWPANGSGSYSEKDVPAAEALAASLNTVAVRWLKEYGAENAMRFLEEGFGIDVSREREIAARLSEEEVYGNLALGYLQNGVSVCGMAGYYRVFASGGRYTPAYAVLSVRAEDGALLYEAAPEEKQVIAESSAWIVNRMLKGAVDNGTGQAARIDGVALVGKTGTSDNYEDNWFVGVTPVNTAAVWHGASPERGNRAAALFSSYFRSSGLVSEEDFIPCEGVEQRVYCKKSGLLAGDNCGDVGLGYYLPDRLPAVCTEH